MNCLRGSTTYTFCRPSSLVLLPPILVEGDCETSARQDNLSQFTTVSWFHLHNFFFTFRILRNSILTRMKKKNESAWRCIFPLSRAYWTTASRERPICRASCMKVAEREGSHPDMRLFFIDWLFTYRMRHLCGLVWELNEILAHFQAYCRHELCYMVFLKRCHLFMK